MVVLYTLPVSGIKLWQANDSNATVHMLRVHGAAKFPIVDLGVEFFNGFKTIGTVKAADCVELAVDNS